MIKKSKLSLILAVVCFIVAAALYIIAFATKWLDGQVVGIVGLILMIVFLILIFLGLFFKSKEDAAEPKN